MDDLDTYEIDTSSITTLLDEEAEKQFRPTDAMCDALLSPIVKDDSKQPGGRNRRDISRFLFVDIETIPDWSRVDSFGLDAPSPPRARKPVEECPDIATVLDQPLEQIKTDLRLTWPCVEWLAAMLDAEQKSKKPRAGVRDAVKSVLSEMDADANAESAFIKKLSVNPQYCRIAAMGLATGESEAVGIIGDEREMLDEFWSLAAISNPVVGFNHTSFDLPVILVRSMILGVEPTRKLDLKPWSDSCLDLMVALFGRGPAIGLKTLAKMYGLPVAAEGCDGSQVNGLMQTDPEKVREYVASDVELTRDLFRKIEGYFV